MKHIDIFLYNIDIIAPFFRFFYQFNDFQTLKMGQIQQIYRLNFQAKHFRRIYADRLGVAKILASSVSSSSFAKSSLSFQHLCVEEYGAAVVKFIHGKTNSAKY